MPMKPKKVPMLKTKNGMSLKAAKLNSFLWLDGRTLCFIPARGMQKRTSMTSPITLTAHPNPWDICNLVKISGNMTPPILHLVILIEPIRVGVGFYIPILLPVEVILYANAFFELKYCEMMETSTMNVQPEPMPTMNPWESSTCQYSVEMLASIIPRMLKIVPVHKRGRT